MLCGTKTASEASVCSGKFWYKHARVHTGSGVHIDEYYTRGECVKALDAFPADVMTNHTHC